jgi:deoxyribodipyrimidine photolyase
MVNKGMFKRAYQKQKLAMVRFNGLRCEAVVRISNPWLQQKRYDPDCSYIKTWNPELRSIVPTRIHSADKVKDAAIPGYLAPSSVS